MKQFYNTSWMSHTSAQFCHYEPEDNTNCMSYRFSPMRLASTFCFMCKHKSRLSPVLLSNWPPIPGSNDPLLGQINLLEQGILWWSSDYGSMLLLQGARVWSLVGELRSHMLCGTAKHKTNRNKTKTKNKTDKNMLEHLTKLGETF